MFCFTGPPLSLIYPSPEESLYINQWNLPRCQHSLSCSFRLTAHSLFFFLFSTFFELALVALVFLCLTIQSFFAFTQSFLFSYTHYTHPFPLQFKMRYAFAYAALVSVASGHGLVTMIKGDNGVMMPGLSSV